VPQDKREAAIDELLEIGGAFDGLLKAQVDLDVESLERLIGRNLPDATKEAVRAAQHKAYRYTFLVSALKNSKFREQVSALTRNGTGKIDAAATALSA
jgi:plasmid stability protein